jgi:uncharacterized protein (DUF486 family)
MADDSRPKAMQMAASRMIHVFMITVLLSQLLKFDEVVAGACMIGSAVHSPACHQPESISISSTATK